MRIEVLPSNITPLPDRKIPNAEEGQEAQSGSTFLDVIVQMTSAAGPSEETSPENASSPGKGKLDEGSCENSTTVALPAAPVSSEIQPFFSDPDAPAAPEVLSSSKMQDRHVPNHRARVQAEDSTANVTGEATSDSTPFSAGNLTSGLSGTAAIPFISWPAFPAPLPPLDSDAAAPRDPAMFSSTVAPEIQGAGVPSESARECAMPVPEGNPLNASPAALPGQASILEPQAVALASPVPTGRAPQLSLFDLPATSAPKQAGTSGQVEFTATAAAPAQSLLYGDAVPDLQADSAAVSSTPSSMASLNPADAVPSGDAPALPASAAPEVLPLSHPPAGAAAGLGVGTRQPEAPEGFRNAELQAGAVEGIRTGRPQVAAPEAFRVGTPQVAAPEGLRMSTPQVAAPEGSHMSTPQVAAPEGLRLGTPQVAAPEGLRPGTPQVAAPEGFRMGTPHAAAPEGLRMSTPQLSAPEALRMNTPQTVPPEGSQIGTAQAVFVEGIRAGYPQAAGTEAFPVSIPPAAVLEGLRTHGRQVAVPENPGSECSQDATQGGARLGAPDIAAPERLRLGHPLEIAPEQSHRSSLTAVVPEKSRMSSSHAAGQSGETLADPVLGKATMPFLRESDISVEVIPSSAPSPREPEVVHPRILPANPMIAVSENTDRNQRPIQAMQLQVPSDPVTPAAVEPVQPTSGEPAEDVHPGAGEQRPWHTRLVLDLSAHAAEVIPDLTAAQILQQGGRRPEPPVQSTRPASVLPFSEAPGNAEGRAELPTNVSDPDLAAPEPNLTGRRSDNEAEVQAGAKPQPLRRQGQEPAQVDVPAREPGRPDSAHRMAPIVVPGANLRGDSSGEGNLLVSLNRMFMEAQRAAVDTARDKTVVRPPLPANDAEAAPAEAPEVPHGFAPDALVRANASMAGTHAALCPIQRSASMTSIPGATGVQLPVYTAPAEIKALAALLAPKSPAPAQEPDFLAQLAARMQMQLRDGESIMRIQLKPSTLGRIEIKAETMVSGVAATILTESPSVKNYLEHNLHILQQSFQDQGLKIDRIQVVVQEGFWAHHSSSGNQESHSGTGQQEKADPTVWKSERVERTVEELALDAHTLALMSPHRTFHTVA